MLVRRDLRKAFDGIGREKGCSDREFNCLPASMRAIVGKNCAPH
jgi:hypothetical protein